MRGKCSLDVEGSKPGPTSMAVSWRANFKGGALGEKRLIKPGVGRG